MTILVHQSAPVGFCYLYVVNIQKEFLYCELLWETSKCSKWQSVSSPSSILTERNVKAILHGWSICFVWPHIWFCSFDEARRPTCHCGWDFLCQCWCPRLQWSWKPALKACSSVGPGALGSSLLGRFCCEMERNRELLRLGRRSLALQRTGLEVLDWTSNWSSIFFCLKVKENAQNRERGIHSWRGFLTRYFWPCEWGKSVHHYSCFWKMGRFGHAAL